MGRSFCVCVVAAALTLLALTGASGPAKGETAALAERRAAFSDGAPAIAADIRAGRPFVTVVVVPLCSNDQIDCGSGVAGRPGDLRTNIYWGAVFGQKRFFNRKNSGWALVSAALDPEPSVLERAVFRRAAPRAAWSAGGGAESIEQIVVLEAVHGDAIDLAVKRFYRLATEGGRVRFQDGGRERDERVHVAGYAGHNRLMDGVKLPPAPAARGEGSAPIPSFVMACQSDAYFSEGLRLGGSEPIVMTRALMAPEGYVVEAIARALGENASPRDVRARAVAAYSKWASLPLGTASWIFAA
jgi:hypothetical protein